MAVVLRGAELTSFSSELATLVLDLSHADGFLLGWVAADDLVFWRLS